MKAKVLHNPKKDWAVKVSKDVNEFLKGKGAQLVSSKADFTVVIGGDGTIFFNKKHLEGAVFGIGGERSFICACTKENWEDALSAFLSNPSTEQRVALCVKFKGKEYRALNDAAILSREHEMLSVSIGIEGQDCPFVGDGLIVSTPTGSTAYAYSSGGPVIEQTLPVFELVPVAPYKRLFDPMVISSTHEIILTANTDSHLVIDGEPPINVKKGEKVKISRHKENFLFATPKSKI